MDSLIQALAIYAVPVLLAITLHEAAHGYVARHFGDQTAARAGRISLNPFKHVDLMGTLVVPIVILVASKLGGTGGMLFGWAKPVPVNFHALRNPRRDMFWVAFAGPGMNLAMAVAWALCFKFSALMSSGDASHAVQAMSAAGIEINGILLILNLLPIPPLDGGRMLVSLLPEPAASLVSRVEPFGLALLLALMFSGGLGILMDPMTRLYETGLARLVGI